MKNIFFNILLLIIVMTFPSTIAAHWIVGYVENASDSTSPNGRTIKLYNSTNLQEIFTIVGPSGPSATSNIYMIDCEMLATPCNVGDVLNITLVDDLTGHVAKQEVQVIVSGAGYDMAPNISMTSPLSLQNVLVEDSFTSPQNEIDLTANSTTKISCTAITDGYEPSTSLVNATATFFASTSTKPSPDDNNNHYTNSTCEINTSYGLSTQAQINCTFKIEYYANADSWTCEIEVIDNSSVSVTANDQTQINTLLAIGANSSIDFGEVNVTEMTPEKTIQITNFGNVNINLTLNGFGETPNDGNSMICSGNNISIEHTKYNLTLSNSGSLTPTQAEAVYKNLTSTATKEEFKLHSRQNDNINNDATNNTYWRVYVPKNVGRSCQGNIIIGATQN